MWLLTLHSYFNVNSFCINSVEPHAVCCSVLAHYDEDKCRCDFVFSHTVWEFCLPALDVLALPSFINLHVFRIVNLYCEWNIHNVTFFFKYIYICVCVCTYIHIYIRVYLCKCMCCVISIIYISGCFLAIYCVISVEISKCFFLLKVAIVFLLQSTYFC